MAGAVRMGREESDVGLHMFAAVLCVRAGSEKTRPGHLVTCGIGSPSLPGLGSAAKWGGHTCGTKAWLIEGGRRVLL